MKLRRSKTRSVLGLVAVAVVGCGRGSRDHASGPSTPTPARTVIATPTTIPTAGARAWAVDARQIIRSDDGGFTWSAPLFARTDVALQGIAFVDRDTGWAVGGSQFGFGAALLHTTDAGVTWTSQLESISGVPPGSGVATQFGFFDVAFASDQHGVAVGAAQQGPAIFGPPPLIVVTDDGGATWRVAAGLSSTRPGILRSVCLTNSGAGVAVGDTAVSGATVAVTTDGGATWADISETRHLAGGDTTLIRSAACAAPSQFWISGVNIGFAGAGARSDLLYSPDGGTSWIDRTPDIGNVTGSTFQLLPLSFVGQRGWTIPGATVLDATAVSPVVLHTTDAGEHWTRQAVPDGFDGTIAALAFADDQHGVAVGGGPADSNRMRPGAAIATDDGGRTWREASFIGEVGPLLDVASVP